MKAEFDSLKNDFQSVINSYNTTIDSKIDYAIAAYISGIKTTNNPTNLWTKVMSATGNKMRFRRDCYDANGVNKIGTSTTTMMMNVITNRYYRKKVYELYPMVVSRGGETQAGFDYGVSYMNNATWSGRVLGTTATTKNQKWTSFTQANYDSGLVNSGSLKTLTKSGNGAQFTESAGSGEAYIYLTNPNGTMTIRKYDTSIYPLLAIYLSGYTYYDYTGTNRNTFMSRYMNTGGQNMTASLSVDIPNKDVSYGVGKTVGTALNTSTATSNGAWATYDVLKIENDNGVDFSVKQWGANTTTEVYTLSNVAPLTYGSKTTKSATNFTYQNLVYHYQGVRAESATFSGIGYTYYPISFTPTKRALNKFTNSYLSTIANETVYLGGGAPFMETSVSDQKVKVDITFKVYNRSGTAISDNIDYRISDRQFTNGGTSTGGKAIVSTSIRSADFPATGKTVSHTITCQRPQIYWINAYSSTAGSELAIENITLTLVD